MSISQHLVNANIDVLFNPLSWLGVYVGIGVGYQGFAPVYSVTSPNPQNPQPATTTTDEGVKGGFSLPLNVGLNFNLGESHTLNVGVFYSKLYEHSNTRFFCGTSLLYHKSRI